MGWPTGTRTEDDLRDGFRVHLRDRKGGDLGELPPDLRVREMPAIPGQKQLAAAPAVSASEASPG